ncbi:unnamed protein product [Cuscuta campestris]|uniref:Uncharacterized protein n=1 Tax=Cuscuta campestris TaxID=132261 RepID=A0A484LU16_9ASTE|nr:unnamed protein product [Cuscuta campestris]
MLSTLNLATQTKQVNMRNREELIDSGAYYRNTESIVGSSSGGSNSNRGVRGPMDRFVVDVNVDTPDTIPKKPMSEREARDRVCLDVGRFYIENGIPFHVANSPSFINMCRAIGNFGRGFKPPTPYELSHWILDEEDIGKLPQHKNALVKAKKVTHYIYNHGWSLALMREFTKRDLVRPAATSGDSLDMTLHKTLCINGVLLIGGPNMEMRLLN